MTRYRPSVSSRYAGYGVLMVILAMVARNGTSQRRPQACRTPDARVQHSVEAIAVAQDGRVLTNSNLG